MINVFYWLVMFKVAFLVLALVLFRCSGRFIHEVEATMCKLWGSGYQLMVHQFVINHYCYQFGYPLTMAMVTLFGAVHFWLKNSTEEVAITPLSRYPTISIVVPAHKRRCCHCSDDVSLIELKLPG